MNPATLLFILQARWLTIANTTLTAILLAGLYIAFTPNTYTATTELLVDSKAQDPVSGEIIGSRLMSSYLATQADIIRSRNVASKVIEHQQLNQEPLLVHRYRASGGQDQLPTK